MVVRSSDLVHGLDDNGSIDFLMSVLVALVEKNLSMKTFSDFHLLKNYVNLTDKDIRHIWRMQSNLWDPNRLQIIE